MVYLDNMSVSIYSECVFFKLGLQHLINECGFLQCSSDMQVCIVHVKKASDSISLLKFLATYVYNVSLNHDHIIVVSPGGYMHGFKWPGIKIVSGSMPLNEWRHCIEKCLDDIRREEKPPLCIVDEVFQRQTSHGEMQLLSCIRLNMSPSEIANLHKVSIKTMYSRIAAVRNKYQLRSTRELYLNADYIYQNINQSPGDNF